MHRKFKFIEHIDIDMNTDKQLRKYTRWKYTKRTKKPNYLLEHKNILRAKNRVKIEKFRKISKGSFWKAKNQL